MQRSRKALLIRRASWKTNEKNFLYKASLSLALFLWGLLFLPNIWTRHRDGFKDGFLDLPKGFKTWDEFKLNPQNLSYVYQVVISNESMVNDRNPTQFSFTNEEPKEMPYSLMKNQRSRSAPLDLNEFKNMAFTFSTKTRASNGNIGTIIHRLEPTGAEYNYASASKGAKILGYNKEAKGALNLLSSDQNKYLRNPCSSNEKFVVLELSEETLIDTIEIANFEHHSSNLKGFQLFGSMVYPTEYWVELGNFTAVNVKHVQRFVLHESKWVRYVKLNLLSHFGTDFYCTLSVFKVYGVDAVEMMLEDLVIARNNEFLSEEHENDRKPYMFEPETEPELEPWLEEFNTKRAGLAANGPDPLMEVRQQQVGRLPGDTVLKILMQKVRLLDINITLLERFLDELTSRYSYIFKEIDAEIGERDVIVAEILTDLRGLHQSNDIVTKHVDDLLSWKSSVSVQLDNIIQDNAFLRLEVAKVRENQERMEDKGVVILVISLIFGSLAIARIFLVNIFLVNYRKDRSRESLVELWPRDYSSGFLLLSCTTIKVLNGVRRGVATRPTQPDVKW